jgi:phasin family protein
MTNTTKKDADILEAGLASSATMITTQTEQAIAMAKANFEQIASKSREAMEQSIQTVDFLTIMTRGNVDALLESSRVAAGSLQNIAHEVADYSKTSFDRTTSAARAISQATTPTELMQLQNEFAQAEFSNSIAQVSKLSEAMFKTMADIFDPLQKQAVASAHKLTTATGAE